MREAVVSLSDSELRELGFGELVSHVREGGIRDIEMLEDEGYTCVPQVEVREKLDGRVLDSLECVDGWELVNEKESGYVYLFELTATGVSGDIVEDFEDLVGTCTPEVNDRGVLLSFVGSQETIREVLRHYEDAGASPVLHKLGDYSGGEGTFDSLTDRQLEVIRTAYDMGFYEIPKEASTDDLARELELDSATVSEHLQRAERNLLTEQLA